LTRATITVSLSPTIHIGPLTLAWHGIMIALGIGVGYLLARRYARERGLEIERLEAVLVIMVVAGIAGARFYFLAQEDAGALVRPGSWFGSTGFAFYGALIVGVLAVAAYLWRRRLGLAYLDALAAGFPLGMAVGRIGDLINGEHYGSPTSAPWGFQYTNAGAEPPSHDVAYQSGAFYEILLALAMLALLWPLRKRLGSRPGLLLATTVALYSLGRFAIFFVIRDTPVVALGLRQAQWTSLALVAVALLGAWWAARGTWPWRDRPQTRGG
jgi:phosphatidylglycerol:prolipoprotein diacylglycerol transferase